MKLPKIIKLPSGNYHCTLKINGQRLYVTEPTRNECRNKVMLLKAEHINGISRNAAGISGFTLRKAINRYIESRSNILSPATIRGYRTIQNNRFKNVMDRRIDSINNWQPIVNSEAQTCGAKTLKNAWGFINSVLKENGVMTHGISLPQVITDEHVFLQPDEIKTFLKAIEGDRYELVYLLALHGMRRSEIMALDIKNSISNKTIKIRGATVPNESNRYVWKSENKNQKSRREIPIMIPRIKDLIKDNPDELQRIIQSTTDNVYKHLRRICENNNMEYMGLHGLRHSFASLCYRLKISEAETMRLGGWSDPGVMRKIYTHLSNLENKEAERKLINFFKTRNVM